MPEEEEARRAMPLRIGGREVQLDDCLSSVSSSGVTRRTHGAIRHPNGPVRGGGMGTERLPPAGREPHRRIAHAVPARDLPPGPPPPLHSSPILSPPGARPPSP